MLSIRRRFRARVLSLAAMFSFSMAVPVQHALGSSSSSSGLVARQSTVWESEYVLKPYNERVYDLGGCGYQLVFRRDRVDSENRLLFYADYPGSSERTEIKPYEGDYNGDYRYSPLGITDDGAFTLPDTEAYILSVHRFRGVCASGTSGSAPTAFYVRSLADSPYLATNYDYISPAITPETTKLPAPPKDVRLLREAQGSNKYNLSWTPTDEATEGYVVLLRSDIYASELGGYLPATLTQRAQPGSPGATFELDGVTSVAVFSQSGTDVISDADKVTVNLAINP
ncbi:hypothetical protein OC835_007298 [Tilletia horrida]|nr:hypothetical protein OC835_007298 [Tilletia horrida]